MTREQLLALAALERDAFYGGNPLFHGMGAGQATSPSHRTPHDAAEGPAAAGNAAPGALPAPSLSGEGIASEPRSGPSPANGSFCHADAPSPVETFAASLPGEDTAGPPRTAGVAPPGDARPSSSGAA